MVSVPCSTWVLSVRPTGEASAAPTLGRAKEALGGRNAGAAPLHSRAQPRDCRAVAQRARERAACAAAVRHGHAPPCFSARAHRRGGCRRGGGWPAHGALWLPVFAHTHTAAARVKRVRDTCAPAMRSLRALAGAAPAEAADGLASRADPAARAAGRAATPGGRGRRQAARGDHQAGRGWHHQPAGLLRQGAAASQLRCSSTAHCMLRCSVFVRLRN